jgi:MFS family permease
MSAFSQSPGLRRAFKLLYLEGAFAIMYDTWVGPTYLSGLAGELGVSVLWVSVISSAAWIGAVGQLFGAWAFERADSYRSYTVKASLAARAFWLYPLIYAAWCGWNALHGGPAFPVHRWFAVVAITSCFSAVFASSSGVAWNSWVRALVPQAIRGRFFGSRHRVVMGALTAAHLVALACVDWRPLGIPAGYAVLGIAGVLCAAASTWLLGHVPEAEVSEKDARRARGRDWLEPLRDERFRNVVIFGAAFHGAVQLASPYFPYWFTKELGIPMSHVAYWLALTNLGCMLAAPFWGKLVDRRGDSRQTLRLTGTLVALSPLFYFSTFGMGARWVELIAPFDYFSNGIIWVGYQLAMTTLLFRSVPNRRAAYCFSLYSAACGVSGAACSLIGGRLALWLAPWGGFQALWVIATTLRLVSIWGLFPLLYSNKKRQGESERGELLAEYAS